jgi:hypothetical protein
MTAGTKLSASRQGRPSPKRRHLKALPRREDKALGEAPRREIRRETWTID